MRVAEVAGGGFERRDTSLAVGIPFQRRNRLELVGRHENASVGTIRGAQAAADAMVFNDDLKMSPAMNGVHRAADHAMRVGARAARSGDDIFVEALAIAQQSWQGHSV